MSKELIEQLATDLNFYFIDSSVTIHMDGFDWGTTTEPHYIVTELELEAFAKAYAQTQGQSIPDGWKLVPIKPTSEMIEAAFSVYDVLDSEEGMVRQNLRNDYKTMLKAAPIESGVKNG
jgi:hypothetical protein